MGDNNTFDKKFRNKMQDFEPDYEDAAWDKFAPQLRPASTPFFAQTKIKSLFYSLSAAAVLGIIFYFYPQKENKPLLENIQNSTETSQNLPKENTQLPAENQVIISPKKENKNRENANNTVAVLPQKQEIADTKNTKIEPVFSPKNESNIVISQKRSTEKIEPKNGNNIPALPKEATEKTTNIVENAPLVKEIIVENEPKISPAPKQEIAVTSNKKSLFVEIDSIENEAIAFVLPKKAISFMALNTVKMPSNKPEFRLNVGANAGFEKEKVATGLLLNATFRQRFGLNVGVNFVQQAAESFRDADEFQTYSGVDFKTIVPDSVPSNALFSEINAQQSKWELPVSLQYQHPIYKNISFVSQIGTNLLLRAKQRFSYQVEAQGQGREEGNFHKYEMPHSFGKRNLPSLGVGLQAEWQDWQVQAMSYIAGSDDENMPRKRHDRKPPIGFQVRLNYTIFKNKPLY